MLRSKTESESERHEPLHYCDSGESMTPIQLTPRWSEVRIFVTLVITFIECILFAGTINGWASLVHVFKADGVYSEFCEPASGSGNVSHVTALPKEEGPLTCPDQEFKFFVGHLSALIFANGVAFKIGHFLDAFGLRVVRMGATVLAGIGFISLGLAGSGESARLVISGAVFMAIGNQVILLTSFHICSVAGERTSTAMGFMYGAISTSVVVFLGIKWAADAGISRLTAFVFLICCWTIILFTTQFLLPRFKVNMPDPEEEQKAKTPIIKSQHDSTHPGEVHHTEDHHDPHVEPPKEEAGLFAFLKGYVGTGVYLAVLFWFSVNQLALATFITGYKDWVPTLVEDDQTKVSEFTHMLSYVELAAIIVAPFAGIMIDSRRKAMKEQGLQGMDKAIGAFPALVFTSVCGVLMSIVIFIPDSRTIYVAVILSVLFRAFLYTTNAAIIELAYPPAHFGKLLGLLYMLGGVAALFQFAVLKANETIGSFLPIHIILLILTVSSFITPIYIKVRHLRGPAHKA